MFKLVNFLYDIRMTGEVGTIPKIQDARCRWLLNGLIGITKELYEKGIDTPDYTNLDNLGIKTDGVLGMFDMGYGNGFSNFENDIKEISIGEKVDLLDKIKELMGIGKSRYLGGGMFGHAHYIGDNKVMKITKDKTEAINSQKLIGQKNRRLSDVYDVRSFKTTKGMIYYVIILEYLKPLRNVHKLYLELLDKIDESINVHLNVDILNGIKDESIRKFLYTLYEDGYDVAWQIYGDEIKGEKYQRYDMNEISEISEWIKGSMTNRHESDEEVPEYIKNYIKILSK